MEKSIPFVICNQVLLDYISNTMCSDRLPNFKDCNGVVLSRPIIIRRAYAPLVFESLNNPDKPIRMKTNLKFTESMCDWKMEARLGEMNIFRMYWEGHIANSSQN